MQHPEGRAWFGKFIDTQRVNNQEVDEHIFYRLVQYFAVCLFECVVADDFAPATSIMNMRYCKIHSIFVAPLVLLTISNPTKHPITL